MLGSADKLARTSNHVGSLVRLADVIVRPGLKATHAVADLGFSGQQHHRNGRRGRCGFDFPQQIDSVPVG